MKQILTAFVVFSVAAAFSGCSDSVRKSTQDAENDSSQSASGSSNEETASKEAASSDTASTETAAITYGDEFPEVLKVTATANANNKWRFDVTLSSEYDSPKRYADAWRVLDDEDEELGIRILGHDHAAEQPFTRSSTIEIPNNINVVFVEGRDQANGWSGQRFKYEMPSNP